MAPLLAMLLSYFSLALVFYAFGKPEFDKVLPFSATIIGSVTGFYFGNRQAEHRAAERVTKAGA